jgi:hypothetical protein
VKVGTSRIVLLVLGAVFLGGMLVLALAGDASARRELPAQVAAWATVGGAVFAAYWFRVRPRRELHREEARSLRLHSAAGDPLHFFDRGFALLAHVGGGKDIENTSWGTWRGMDVVVIDYWFASTHADSPSETRAYTCAATTVPAGWPDLSIVPAGLGAALVGAVHRDIEFEVESFNRAFEVRSSDRRFAHALIDARMIAWLQGLPPDTGFELLGGTLLCRTPRVPDRDLTWALETMAEFQGRVPPVVRSLFGPTV